MGKTEKLIGLGMPTPLASYVATEDVGTALVALGSTIADALALTANYNNIGTVSNGTGVLLPDDDIGRQVRVRNAGANTLSVYPPTSSGTLNNLSAGIAFPLVAQCVATFTKVTATAWLVEIGASQGVENGITAAGTIITDAYDLTKSMNGVTTTAAGTGVQLFASTIGIPVYVGNGGANTLNVFPPDASSTINNGSAGAAKTLATGVGATFVRMTSTAWVMC